MDPGSEDAWRRFRRYFTVIGPFSRLIRRSLLAEIARDLGDEDGRPGVRGAVAGFGGLGIIAAALATPYLRARRATWGAGAEVAGRRHPGDDLVPEPRWGWTHATVVDVPAAEVWPWIAQIGADRAGFYSYTWLENLVGCGVRDAARIHPEWQARTGDPLVLHPAAPALTLVKVTEGRHMVAHGPADEAARAAGRPWAAASWLFAAEPLGPRRTRIVSRYRCATSDDRRTRLTMGPAILEPISFAMDRRMLLGIARRVGGGRP